MTQPTLFATYIRPLKAQSHHAKQDEAVADWLLKYGEIDRDWAYMNGLPVVGRIKNLGARILELRKRGWQIETLEAPTRYRLISAPTNP